MFSLRGGPAPKATGNREARLLGDPVDQGPTNGSDRGKHDLTLVVGPL